MELEALWKEQRDFNALSVSAREGEGHDNRVLEQKTLCSGPRTIHHHARPGLAAESHSAEIPRSRCYLRSLFTSLVTLH